MLPCAHRDSRTLPVQPTRANGTAAQRKIAGGAAYEVLDAEFKADAQCDDTKVWCSHAQELRRALKVLLLV